MSEGEKQEFGIDWSKIVGDRRDIKYARRDLAGLKRACDLCRDFSCAVQAGANIGIFPLYLLQRFELVHAYEPDLESFEAMCENAPHYLFEGRLAKHDSALGRVHARGYLQLRRRDGTTGHSGINHIRLDNSGEGIPVAVETIDGLRLPTCGLIYLDVEGFELEALRGGLDTLQRCRPVIGVEINKNLEFMGIKPSDVVSWISDQRYELAASMNSDKIFTPREWR